MTISIRPSSAWALPQIEQFLKDIVIPVNLACLASNEVPINCSLWYLYDSGLFWCATQRNARVVKYLGDRPRCGFEIASQTIPYRGVRGQGKATISDTNAAEILTRLIDRYLHDRNSRFARWLLGRADTEVAISIRPSWMTSWDFSTRMSQASPR